MSTATVLPLIADEAQAIFDQAATPPVFLLPVFVLGFGLGWILLGVATIRASVLPRWSGLLLIIGVTLFVISEVLPCLEGHSLLRSAHGAGRRMQTG